MPRSKRPSGSRSDSSSPSASPPELFCDRSLGRGRVPAMLRSLHPVVIAHDDVFPQDVDDDVWLREAGRRGWVVLTATTRSAIALGSNGLCSKPEQLCSA